MLDAIVERRSAASYEVTKNAPSQEPECGESINLESFMPLVRSIATHIHSSIPFYAGVELADLIQTGYLGLARAGRAYRTSRGVAFATFARFRIRGEILDSLRRSDAASRTLRGWDKRLRAAEQTLTNELKRQPTETELCARLSIALESFHDKRYTLDNVRVPRWSIPLDRERTEWHVCHRTPELLNAESQGRELIERNILKLPPRWRDVIVLYYNHNLTMKQIGERLSVNESRVSQIHRNALHRLSRHLKASGVSSSGHV